MIAGFIYLLALCLWVGSVAFFSFGVAPSLFSSLSVVQAGEAIGTIFPMYYAFGAVSGAVTLVAAWFVWGHREARGWRIAHTAIAAAMLLATLVAAVFIRPRASELRPLIHGPDASPEAKAEFDSLHRSAVQLNGAVLLGGLVLLGGAARRLRREPR